jgi:ribosome recycling factor
MSVESILKKLDDELQKTLEHLHEEYAAMQIGRASAALVERIQVEVYGVVQPLKAIASISVPDARTIQIQPWDRGTLAAIEKAIMLAELGLTPQNDGIVVRLNIPALTEDRRRDLTKLVSKMAEEAKISVRNVRHEAMEEIKKDQKANLVTEDQQTFAEKKIQEQVDAANESIEKASREKEADVLKV